MSDKIKRFIKVWVKMLIHTIGVSAFVLCASFGAVWVVQRAARAPIYIQWSCFLFFASLVGTYLHLKDNGEL